VTLREDRLRRRLVGVVGEGNGNCSAKRVVAEAGQCSKVGEIAASDMCSSVWPTGDAMTGDAVTGDVVTGDAVTEETVDGVGERGGKSCTSSSSNNRLGGLERGL
jgi:hypothetical protein